MPDLVVVPTMNLFTLQQATDALGRGRLTVGPIVGDSTHAVAGSTPPAGTPRPRGSAVGLTFFP